MVWNNPFEVDDPFTERPVDLDKQKLKTVPEANFKIQILFFKSLSFSGITFTFLL